MPGCEESIPTSQDICRESTCPGNILLLSMELVLIIIRITIIVIGINKRPLHRIVQRAVQVKTLRPD